MSSNSDRIVAFDPDAGKSKSNKISMDNLPVIYDFDYLAFTLGVDKSKLQDMIDSPEKYYRTFYIKKRNGKLRQIDEPDNELKRIQRWILTEILYKMTCSDYAKAYIPAVSIKENAIPHLNCKTLVAIDIKDFFPSIKLEHILPVFSGLDYCGKVIDALAKLCCLNDCLPQGAPTSAYLSNLVMKDFDIKIGNYCNCNMIKYTRYADDMTFSGTIRLKRLITLVDNGLDELGLKSNNSKFKIMRDGHRKKVTGIVVNEKMQVSRDYRMRIKQEIYYIEKFGLQNHISHIGADPSNYISHLMGKIQYALSINPNDAQMKLCCSKLKTYAKNIK